MKSNWNSVESQINPLYRRHYNTKDQGESLCSDCKYGHVIEIDDYDKQLISCYKKGHTVAIDTCDQPCWQPREKASR